MAPHDGLGLARHPFELAEFPFAARTAELTQVAGERLADHLARLERTRAIVLERASP